MEMLLEKTIGRVLAAADDVHLNEKKCMRFAERVREAKPSILDAASAARLTSAKSGALHKLNEHFVEAAAFMAAFKNKSWVRRAFNHDSDAETFDDLNTRLTELLQLLQLDQASAAQRAANDAADKKADRADLDRKAENCDDCEAVDLRKYLKEGSARGGPTVKLLDKLDFADKATGMVCGGKTKPAILGKGTFGTIYRMKDKVDRGNRAVKMVSIDGAQANGVSIADMQKESRALFAMQHKNIIRYDGAYVHEIMDLDGDMLKYYCIVMEYADGGTLAQLLEKLREQGAGRKSIRKGSLFGRKGVAALTEDDIKRYLLQMCSAMHHMHREVRMLHRDFKPANVLLHGGNIKICDFGLCKYELSVCCAGGEEGCSGWWWEAHGLVCGVCVGTEQHMWDGHTTHR